jgi:hypothetical protein
MWWRESRLLLRRLGQFAASRSVLEGVRDFVYGLLGVAGAFPGPSLGPEPPVSGHAAGAQLCFSFSRLGLVPDLLENTHGGSPSRGILSATVRQAMDA